ncbi:hypothetical protein OZ411_22410 [Bradyrhizobium sp. Arg237L]|uniref:hypothetical protein n=1 Tax=Bradyrhizobium sp. Arg237L TaxID=3003352 RepID=UPI00249E4496|nr:hypothetical protein [Bradyrhizobium sp. Arg237L]MDI4235564.1 hypothetical protein [Bradyrhizobium sp. Arg237L]
MKYYYVGSKISDEHAITDVFRRDGQFRAMRQHSVHAGARVVDPHTAGIAAARESARREWGRTAEVWIRADGCLADSSVIFNASILIDGRTRFAGEIRFAIQSVGRAH